MAKNLRITLLFKQTAEQNVPTLEVDPNTVKLTILYRQHIVFYVL